LGSFRALMLKDKPKVVVVMPAYNAERTLKITYEELPREHYDHIILVDDGSSDNTVRLACELGLTVFIHQVNLGYGANQKTCYREALRSGADIIVMVHPDYQYDPTLLPQMLAPIRSGAADLVFGSRLLGQSALAQGMPWWKYYANRFLTAVENWAFGLRLSEFHTGYRAYTRDILERVNFLANSNDFIFDQEIVAQFVEARARFAETPVPTRYFPEASSAGVLASTVYGLKILRLVARYLLHRAGIWSKVSLLPVHEAVQVKAEKLSEDASAASIATRTADDGP
jgi:glycosyltransferase involved in cell wall biosynthesis